MQPWLWSLKRRDGVCCGLSTGWGWAGLRDAWEIELAGRITESPRVVDPDDNGNTLEGILVRMVWR